MKLHLPIKRTNNEQWGSPTPIANIKHHTFHFVEKTIRFFQEKGLTFNLWIPPHISHLDFHYYECQVVAIKDGFVDIELKSYIVK